MQFKPGRVRRGPAIIASVTLVAVVMTSVPVPLEAQALASAAAVFKKVGPSVGRLVVLDAKGEVSGSATVFVVAANGLVVTNYHCLVDKAEGWAAEKARVELPGRDALDVEGVIAFSADKDWALLKVTATSDLPALRLGDAAKLEKGEPLIAIGYPAGLESRPTNGTFSGWHEEQILHDASTSSGNSGGPLLDAAGNVVGITRGEIRSTSERVALNDLFFAVDIRHVVIALTQKTATLTKLPIVKPSAARTAAGGKADPSTRSFRRGVPGIVWAGAGAVALTAGGLVVAKKAVDSASGGRDIGQFSGTADACGYQTHQFQLSEPTTVTLSVQSASTPAVSFNAYVFVGQCSGAATFTNMSSSGRDKPGCGVLSKVAQLGSCSVLEGGYGFLSMPSLPAGPYTIAVHNPGSERGSYTVSLTRGF
jgi:S1-C subfamily serine protease